jgi:dienelactone hydrolase
VASVERLSDNAAQNSMPTADTIQLNGDHMQRLSVLIAIFALCSASGCKPAGKGGKKGKQVGKTGKALPALPPIKGNVRDVALRYFDHIRHGRYDKAIGLFSAKMKAKMPKKRLEAAWGRVIKKAGAVDKVLRIRRRYVKPSWHIFLGTRFEKGGYEIRIVMTKHRRVDGFSYRPAPEYASSDRTPPYAKIDSFKERKISLGQDPWKVNGLLALPKKSATKLPAVVLVHGSGPFDRDNTIGPNKPFRDLAWGLASKGVAVLRYDKRPFAHRKAFIKAFDKITIVQEIIEDAISATKWLATQPEIDPKRIFVLGHSFGAQGLPRIVEAVPSLAGVIVAAGNSTPLEESLLAQHKYLVNFDKRISNHEQLRLRAVEAKIKRLSDKNLAKLPRTQLPLNLSAAYWIDLRKHPAPKALAALDKPILFLQGGRDYQVSKKDIEGWKVLFKGKKNATFRHYPAANHAFIPGKGPAHPRDYKLPGHVVPAVIDDIAKFVGG